MSSMLLVCTLVKCVKIPRKTPTTVGVIAVVRARRDLIDPNCS